MMKKRCFHDFHMTILEMTLIGRLVVAKNATKRKPEYVILLRE